MYFTCFSKHTCLCDAAPNQMKQQVDGWTAWANRLAFGAGGDCTAFAAILVVIAICCFKLFGSRTRTRRMSAGRRGRANGGWWCAWLSSGGRPRFQNDDRFYSSRGLAIQSPTSSSCCCVPSLMRSWEGS